MPVVKASESDFKPMPAGTHLARCYGMVSLGTQPANNPQFKPTFKIMYLFEVPEELTEQGKPFTIAKEFSAFLSEKANLRHALEGWRGRAFTKEELDGFDVAKVVGHPCMISVVHKTSAKNKVYSDIISISAPPKGLQCKPQVHAKVVYEIEMGKGDVYKSLPEYIQKKIAQCLEWTTPAPSEPEYDGSSDVPLEEGEEPPF